MSTKITKSNADIAWKLYNYLNVWEDKIFGKKSPNNAIYMFILTMVALNNELTLSDIINKGDIEYKEAYRYIDSLVRYMKYRPQKKEFMLNEVAYKKDWVGLHVI